MQKSAHISNDKNIHSYLEWQNNKFNTIQIAVDSNLNNDYIQNDTLYIKTISEQLDLTPWIQSFNLHYNNSSINSKYQDYLPTKKIIDLETQSVQFNQYELNNIHAQYIQNNPIHHTLNLNSSKALGTIEAINNELSINMQKLDLQPNKESNGSSQLEFLKKYNINCNIDSFTNKYVQNMQLSIQTTNNKNSVYLDHFNLFDLSHQLIAKGQWLYSDLTNTNNQTNLNIELSGNNISELGNFITSKEHFLNTKGKIEAFLSWQDSPNNLNIENINGICNINVLDGTIVNFEHKILNTINNIFKTIDKSSNIRLAQGTEFSKISGKITVKNQEAHLENIVINLPVTGHKITGTINLNNRNIDLQHSGFIRVLNIAHKLLPIEIPTDTTIYHVIKGTIDHPKVMQIYK